MQVSEWIELGAVVLTIGGGAFGYVRYEMEKKVDKTTCTVCTKLNDERHKETMDTLQTIIENIQALK